MYGTPAESLVGLFLSIDRPVVLYLLLMDCFFSLAVAGLLGRDRRWLELVAIFGVSFVAILIVAWAILHGLLDRPFFRFEYIHFP